MVPPEISAVISHLNNMHIPASSDWIKACIEWCKTEVPNSCKTHKGLANTVLSQWLDTDLRAEGVQSGPQVQISLLHIDKLKSPFPLEGIFTLQLQGWYDISKPAYSQLQILKKIDNENSEVTSERTQFIQSSSQNIAPTRMLKLELNDGFSTITAIEHEYFGNKINDKDLRAGTKVRLIGPLHIRRGRIMLNARNIELVGGYVDEMELEAGLEKTLTNILTPESGSGSDMNAGIPKLPTQSYHQRKPEVKLNSSTHTNSSRSLGRKGANDVKKETIFTDEDDAIFSVIDTEEVKELSDGDDDLFQAIETNETKTLQASNSSSSNESSNEIHSKQYQRQGNEAVTSEKKLKLETRHQPETEITFNKPFQYLSLVHNKTRGNIVTIKGCVVSVLGKLTVKPGNRPGQDSYWYILILVTDGSDTVQASLSPQILENWLGVSPKVYMAMADDGKARIKENMRKISEKLITINAIMKVCYMGDSIYPEIIDVTDVNRGHLQQLKIRQKK